jgi:sulfur-oxidizing protein SoxZ
MATTPPALQIPVRLTFAGALRPNHEIEVRLMLGHDMETGYRHDSSGVRVAKNILETITVTLNQTQIFEATLGTGMAANPMLFFPLTLPPDGGTLTVTWMDDQGRSGSSRKLLVYE